MGERQNREVEAWGGPRDPLSPASTPARAPAGPGVGARQALRTAPQCARFRSRCVGAVRRAEREGVRCGHGRGQGVRTSECGAAGRRCGELTAGPPVVAGRGTVRRQWS